MCDPFTAAAAGIGIASTILGTVASVNTNRYQAAVADNAARAATQQAGFEASRQASDTGRLLSRQRAAYAAAGIGSSGTPLDVGVDLASEGRMDERQTLYEGALQANTQEANARLSRYSARADLLQGLTQIGSDLLGAGSDLFGGAGQKASIGVLKSAGRAGVSPNGPRVTFPGIA